MRRLAVLAVVIGATSCSSADTWTTEREVCQPAAQPGDRCEPPVCRAHIAAGPVRDGGACCWIVVEPDASNGPAVECVDLP